MVFVTVILLLGWLAMLWRWPDNRRTMYLGAVFSWPFIVVELWLTGDLGRLGASTGAQWLNLVTIALSTMSLSALAAFTAQQALIPWWGTHAHPSRSRLWWLITGLVAAGILFLSGLPAPVALMFGLALNAILVVTIERDLLWDAALSSLAFAGLFLLLDIVIGVRSSGDIARLLIGSTTIGLTPFGLPIERLLTMGLLGGLIGPLFSATKFHRSPAIVRHAAVPWIKVVVVTAVTLIGTGAIGYAAPIYVFPPAVESVEPSNAAADVPLASDISVRFNRPIDRQTLNLEITPAVTGSWSFDEPRGGDHGYRRALFTFDSQLPAGTTFHVRLIGIRSIWRLAGEDYNWTFTTPAPPTVKTPEPVVVPPVTVPTPTPAPTPVPTPVVVTPPAPVTQTTTSPAPTQNILNIKQDYQDQSLSCEAAALKMALAGRGVRVSESDIMKIVGYDPTPHSGNVWGDPNVAFVGNIAGRQNTTGYGVYWDPIARAASHWRTARAITHGTVKQLAQELYASHPVVIWGTLGRAYRDDWVTPSGKKILAWKGEHARTVIGVVGPVDNPTSFVINDPVAGRVTWSAAKLDANWASFGRAAVIVE